MCGLLTSVTLSPQNLGFSGKVCFWTDSSDSCTLKGLTGASPQGSVHWAVIWCPGTNKNPWSSTTALLSSCNPISEPVVSRGKWKHSGLEFPRWLYSFIKFLVSPASWDFLRPTVMVHQGMTQQLNIVAAGCKYTVLLTFLNPADKLEASHHC